MFERIIEALTNVGPVGIVFAIVAGLVLGSFFYFRSGKR